MKINPNPVAPGAYEIFLGEEEIAVIKEFENLPEEFFKQYCSYLVQTLGLDYTMHQVYDYRYVIKKGHISNGSYNWHNDKDDNMDCILMIYVVDPEINETTGMRVGFRDSTVAGSERFMNIQTGTAFLTRQDHPKFQHKVENIKGNINHRACISLSLSGIKNTINIHNLKE